MKKLAFILTIFCALVSGMALAKTASTMNVKLYPIQTILIGTDNTVNLEYQTKEQPIGTPSAGGLCRRLDLDVLDQPL